MKFNIYNEFHTKSLKFIRIHMNHCKSYESIRNRNKSYEITRNQETIMKRNFRKSNEILRNRTKPYKIKRNPYPGHGRELPAPVPFPSSSTNRLFFNAKQETTSNIFLYPLSCFFTQNNYVFF